MFYNVLICKAYIIPYLGMNCFDDQQKLLEYIVHGHARWLFSCG